MAIDDEWIRRAELLHDEINGRFTQLQSEIDRRFADLRYYTGLTTTAMDARLTTMNAFRDSLRDQQGTFLTRDEYSTAHGGLADKIDKLDNRVTSSEGKITGQAESRTGARMSQAGVMQLVVTAVAFATLVLYI